ncbi:MAG TPA: TatD family hydrolase [candidate division Zixibacteria bacterium]|nr:TatD family hydrolase [candidate division Zixibacteria bacterium]
MIDSHSHPYLKANRNQQDDLIKEAVDSGISAIICIGIDTGTSRQSIELAERFDEVYATVGLHPHDAAKFSDAVLKELRNLAAHKKVVAIGETGLDFYRNLSPKEIQQKAFEAQLELAAELEKPVVIHTRESLEAAIATVNKFKSKLAGGVFHCFPGTASDSERVFELGFSVSFGGVITFRNSQMSKVAQEVDLENVILETDAPYLTPEPLRGKPNRPSYVRLVYEKLAEIRGVSFEQIEKQIDRNCRKLFRLVETFEG